MPSPRLLFLESDLLRVGIAPRAGGRVVFVGRPGGENVLKVDPVLLEGHRWSGKVTPLSRFEQWNGHTVWLGPQSKFWSDQKVHAVRKRKKAVWPPDPYLEKGGYEVTHATAHAVTMVSPESPISGVQLAKTVRLDSSGKVHFKVTATNVRTRSVSWDLWLNTRVDGYSRTYVPLGPGSDIRIQRPPRKAKRRADLMEFHDTHDYFTFNPEPPSRGVPNRWAKAFLHPSAGVISAFTTGGLFLIRFPHHAQKSIHPEQALVELYNSTGKGAAGALLELEYHAPYRTLKSGESMSAEQTWELLDYSGTNDAESHTSFLRRHGV